MELIWIGIAILAVVIELLTPSAFVSIWIGVGALAAWICALLGLDFAVQLIVCILVSALFIVVCRPLAMKYLRGNIVATNADRLIGEQGIVTKEITPDAWGEVHINGSQWSAVSVEKDTIGTGEKVFIVAIEGAKLLVRKLNI